MRHINADGTLREGLFAGSICLSRFECLHPQLDQGCGPSDHYFAEIRFEETGWELICLFAASTFEM